VARPPSEMDLPG